MKYIADRGYTDLQLNRYVNKDDELEKIYEEAGVELTEERKDYLVNERKLYISVKEVSERNVRNITPVDDVPEGETIVDRLDTIADTDKQEQTPEGNVNPEENNTDEGQTNGTVKATQEGTTPTEAETKADGIKGTNETGKEIQEDTTQVEAETNADVTEQKAKQETSNITSKDKKKKIIKS